MPLLEEKQKRTTLRAIHDFVQNERWDWPTLYQIPQGVCRFARLHPERYKILTKTFDFQFLGSCRRPHEVITP